MQSMNLRFEQMVNTVQSIQPDKTQGLSSVSQNDSSFKVALDKAQKDLDTPSQDEVQSPVSENAKNPEAAKTTDGTQEIQDSQKKFMQNVSESETSDEKVVENVKISDKELSYILDSDTENLFADEIDFAKFDSSKLKTGKLEFYEKSAEADRVFESENGISIDEILDMIDKNAMISEKNPVENASEFSESDGIQISEKNEKLQKKSEKESPSDDMLLYAVLTGQSINDVENSQKLSPENEKAASEKIGKSEKKDSAPVISVVDERTSVKSQKNADSFVTSIEKTGNNEVEMSMNLASKNAASIEFDGVSQNGIQQSDSSHFSQMLSQQIQTNAADFVKAGNLILKDDNKATINLVLHPEDLGNVKIQLEVTDKVIAGKIVVATKEAYDAFNQNMNSLRDAFTAGGFDTGSFDLSWSGQNEKDGKQEQNNLYGTLYQDRVPDVNDEFYGSEIALDAIMYGSSLINIIA